MLCLVARVSTRHGSYNGMSEGAQDNKTQTMHTSGAGHFHSIVYRHKRTYARTLFLGFDRSIDRWN
jgi:hypothetical protein